MKKLFLIAAILIASTAAAQEKCRCEQTFEWMKSTFEANDAGFDYILKKKGQAAYDQHNARILARIATVETVPQCTGALNDWLMFFRRGHIGMQQLFRVESTAAAAPEAVGAEPEMWSGDVTKFEKAAAATDDPLTGVWEFPEVYKMGLVKDGNGYMARVIESSYDGVKVGDPILKITRGRTTFYNNGQPTETINGAPELIADRFMNILGQVTLRRAGDEAAVDPGVERYLKTISNRDWTPWIEQLDPTTMYIRIRSFMPAHGETIERLVDENFAKLTTTENLIIDVRGNGGGGDGAFYSLLPLLYTNPVRSGNVALRASELNIAKWAEQTKDEDPNTPWGRIVARMKAAPDEFVPLFDEDVRVETRDTVYRFPRRVGVLVDEGCASATEQFLFYAKQSWKVKLFGVSTHGAFDVSNTLDAISPDGRYQLRYTSSIGDRIHGMAIDDIGLQPDFYLDPSIPRWKWVDHVNEVLNYE